MNDFVPAPAFLLIAGPSKPGAGVARLGFYFEIVSLGILDPVRILS